MLGFGALYAFIRRQIGLRTDAASDSGSLHAKVADLKDTVESESSDIQDAITAKSAIKSIQRGTSTFVVGDRDITISAVTMDKSFIQISANCWDTSGGSWYARLTSTTNLRVTGAGGVNSLTFAWEVIEHV